MENLYQGEKDWVKAKMCQNRDEAGGDACSM